MDIEWKIEKSLGDRQRSRGPQGLFMHSWQPPNEGDLARDAMMIIIRASRIVATMIELGI